nr:receptor-like serine/threonine-protein kinase ALE2 isoform X1 [Ipomoea batatas]
MVAHHRFMMLKFCLVLLSVFSVQESAAGFYLLSWKVDSVLHHFKEAINELGYHVTGGARLVLLQDGTSIASYTDFCKQRWEETFKACPGTPTKAKPPPFSSN